MRTQSVSMQQLLVILSIHQKLPILGKLKASTLKLTHARKQGLLAIR
jgi:hypothetical protein